MEEYKKYIYDENQVMDAKKILSTLFSEEEIKEILQFIEQNVEIIVKSICTTTADTIIQLIEKDNNNSNLEQIDTKKLFIKYDFVRGVIRDSIMSSLISTWYLKNPKRINKIVEQTYKINIDNNKK